MKFKCDKCGLGPCHLSTPEWSGEVMKNVRVPLGECPLGGDAEFIIVKEY